MGKPFFDACAGVALVTLAVFAWSTPARAEPGPPDRIIVAFDPAPGSAAERGRALGRALGVELEHLRAGANGIDVFIVNQRLPAADVAALAARVAAQPGVRHAEPDLLLQHQFLPDDPRFNEQWHYYEPTGGINAPTAWDTSAGAGVTVAIIDTGVRPHADLAPALLPGYDMISDAFVANDGDGRDADASDPGDWTPAGACGFNSPPSTQWSSWHGTHVAGTVAAVTGNSVGVAGVAHAAAVLPVRVLGRCGGYLSDIADAMVWAAGGSVPGVPDNAHPATVLNLSLGGSGRCGGTLQAAVDAARTRGASVVVAAGNSGGNTRNALPANCRNVVAVAATDRDGGKAWYSNGGKEVALAGPGGDTSFGGAAGGVLSTLNAGLTTPASDAYAAYQGTSMATPHVAGVAALMRAANPGLSVEALDGLLASSARSFPKPCSGCGAGIVDAAAAVAAAVAGGAGGGGDDGGGGGGEKPCRGNNKNCR